MAANGARPNEVGILAMDVYFPKTYVAQEDLEKHDGVSQGLFPVTAEALLLMTYT